MAQALAARGADEPEATLAATYGVLAFSRAMAAWSTPGSDTDLATVAWDALAELRSTGATLV